MRASVASATAIATATFVFSVAIAEAESLKPLDVSGCHRKVGGWQVCPQFTPELLLSDEQYKLLTTTPVPTMEDVDKAAKALTEEK